MIDLYVQPRKDVHAGESRIRLKTPADLSEVEIHAWRAMTSNSLDLQSPFFQPEYIQAVGAYCPNVEVAVLEERGEIVGFFPFQRSRFRSAKPVGGKLTDFQGMIGHLPAHETTTSLLAKCQLSSWNYDHLPATQETFASGSLANSNSPYLDLSQGWETYEQRRSKSGSRVIHDAQRKRRKLAREVGDVRFVPECNDPEVFRTLLQWKSEQRKRTKTFDVLQLQWVVDLLEHLWKQKGESITGQLSALFAGEQLAAVHFGIATKTVHHFWFPAYNPELSKYSAGVILFLDCAQHAAERGAVRLDLGKGNEQFKQRLASGSVEVLEGGVDSNEPRRCYRRICQLARTGARRLPLQSVLHRSKCLIDTMCYR